MSRFVFLFLVLSLCAGGLHAQSGFVRSGGQPIPGATVTATQGSQTFSTVTDADGHYGFPPLATGEWTVTTDMFGFEPKSSRSITKPPKVLSNFDTDLYKKWRD